MYVCKMTHIAYNHRRPEHVLSMMLLLLLLSILRPLAPSPFLPSTPIVRLIHLKGQPGVVEPSLQFIVNQTTLHLILVNLLIVIVQVLLGLGFLLLPDRWVKELVIVSFIWALIVWYGGEGMSMLLTGTSSILSGAPGAALLYPLLGLTIIPRQSSGTASALTIEKAGVDGVLSRRGTALGSLRFLVLRSVAATTTQLVAARANLPGHWCNGRTRWAEQGTGRPRAYTDL